METKKGGFNFFCIPFIKLHVGISTVVCGSFWGLNKFKMVVVAMVTKVQKMLNGNRTADPLETWHRNRSSLKVVIFVFKIFKMAANIKIKKNRNKLLTIQKWKDFNGNGYLQGVRYAAPYGDILVCYGVHFEFKMTAKIQKSSDLGKIWLPSRLWCCELISILLGPMLWSFRSYHILLLLGRKS